MQPAQVENYFERYGWTPTRIGDQTWEAAFAGDSARLTVSVELSEDWLSFSIDVAAYWRLDHSCQALLAANEQMRLVKFALDAQGHLKLQTEMPTEGFAYSHFADCLGALSHYADIFVAETERHKP